MGAPTRVIFEKPKTSNEANDLENRKRSPLRYIVLLCNILCWTNKHTHGHWTIITT